MTTDPIEEVQVHYANKDFKGKSLNDISMQAGQIRFTIESDSGERLPLYRAGQSYYVAGKAGQSYQLHYRNSSDKTYEIVASVDGIDVLDGSSASRSNSGYVLSPHDDLTIEGFRKSEDAVASFTFSNQKTATPIATLKVQLTIPALLEQSCMKLSLLICQNQRKLLRQNRRPNPMRFQLINNKLINKKKNPNISLGFFVSMRIYDR